MSAQPVPAASAGTQPDATADFAKFLCETRYEDIPAAAIAATKRSIFDTVGVMLAGSGPSGTARKIVGMLEAWGGAPEATVIGHPARLPAPHAAFANGSMAHQYDFDDTHDEAVAHPTANSLPAGLAVAEARGNVSGRELLRAVALANDVSCRLGLAVIGSLYEYPWTRPPIIGIYGATSAAAIVLGLRPETIESAFGLTLHQTGNTLECLYASGSEVRGFRDGFSARNGVTAAYMAAAGVRGDRSALEGKFGLFNAFFRGEYRREALLKDLGSHFVADRISIKPWPSARETHATLQAVLELRAAHKLAPGDVREVRLHVGGTNLHFCEPAAARRRPAGRMDALGSLPFAVAVALQHGSVPLVAYTDAALKDAAVLALADRVSWQVDAARSADGTIEGATVEIETSAGVKHRHSVRHGMGHPDAPLTDAVIKHKFEGCGAMAHRPPATRDIERLWQAVQSLDSIAVREFAELLPR
ncbi:MAG: MmgE/PrpD family protein [Betaproteobacteria bacterium]|nr:MmgE/PrpD family protein [Betaproteobacteria bacterium]